VLQQLPAFLGGLKVASPVFVFVLGVVVVSHGGGGSGVGVVVVVIVIVIVVVVVVVIMAAVTVVVGVIDWQGWRWRCWKSKWWWWWCFLVMNRSLVVHFYTCFLQTTPMIDQLYKTFFTILLRHPVFCLLSIYFFSTRAWAKSSFCLLRPSLPGAPPPPPSPQPPCGS
jgi:hypothetical protein